MNTKSLLFGIFSGVVGVSFLGYKLLTHYNSMDLPVFLLSLILLFASTVLLICKILVAKESNE